MTFGAAIGPAVDEPLHDGPRRSVDARCYHLAGDANWSAVNSMVSLIRRRTFGVRFELDIQLGQLLWDSPAGYGGGGPVRVFT